MTAAQVIGEIVALPEDERRQVIEFTRKLENSGKLSPTELGELSSKLSKCDGVGSAAVLREEIVAGFYGK